MARRPAHRDEVQPGDAPPDLQLRRPIVNGLHERGLLIEEEPIRSLVGRQVPVTREKADPWTSPSQYLHFLQKLDN